MLPHYFGTLPAHRTTKFTKYSKIVYLFLAFLYFIPEGVHFLERSLAKFFTSFGMLTLDVLEPALEFVDGLTEGVFRAKGDKPHANLGDLLRFVVRFELEKRSA